MVKFLEKLSKDELTDVVDLLGVVLSSSLLGHEELGKAVNLYVNALYELSKYL